MKKGPWKIISAVICAAYLIYIWSKQDIEALSATVAAEEMLPMMVTTVAVTVLKVALLAAALWGLKWLGTKFKKRK